MHVARAAAAAAAAASAGLPTTHTHPNALLCRQYEPDALFQPISLAQPKLDCSGVGLDGEQELWLLQLPLDVRPTFCRELHCTTACV